jgi:hypothetical protein
MGSISLAESYEAIQRRRVLDLISMGAVLTDRDVRAILGRR